MTHNLWSGWDREQEAFVRLGFSSVQMEAGAVVKSESTFDVCGATDSERVFLQATTGEGSPFVVRGSRTVLTVAILAQVADYVPRQSAAWASVFA